VGAFFHFVTRGLGVVHPLRSIPTSSLLGLTCPHVVVADRRPDISSDIVIAGLDPAIHPFAKMMDARIKPAHDE
jgi:hypothetical protein